MLVTSKIKSQLLSIVFFFKRAIITWYSKQQQTISTSISKAKYIVISQGARKGI